MNPEVRRLSAENLAVLLNLFDYEDTVSMLERNRIRMERGSMDIFVLYLDGEPAGELRAAYEKEDIRYAEKNKRAYLYAFRIREAFQGNGWGTKLLQYVLDWLAHEGYTEYTIGVEDDNLRARHIYEKAGFTEYVLSQTEEYEGSSYMFRLLLKK